MPKINNKNDKIIPLKKLAVSASLGLSVFVILLLTAALISSKSAYPKENMAPYLLICSAVSGFFAGLFSTLKERKNGLISGLITGIVLSFTELLLLLVFSAFSVNTGIFLIIPCCIIPAAVSGIIGVNINLR